MARRRAAAWIVSTASITLSHSSTLHLSLRGKSRMTMPNVASPSIIAATTALMA